MNEIRDIHKPLIRFLRANNLPYINHRPDVKSGIRSGWPDFSIFLAGRCLFLEAKTEKGEVSPKQWLCIADLERSGNPVKIVRSSSEAISAVMEWAVVEKLATEAPRSSECPLDNERAAELIAAATDLTSVINTSKLLTCQDRIENTSKVPSTSVINATDCSPKQSLTKTGDSGLEECTVVDGASGTGEQGNTLDPNAKMSESAVRSRTKLKKQLDMPSEQEKSSNPNPVNDAEQQQKKPNCKDTTKITNSDSPLSGFVTDVIAKSTCSRDKPAQNLWCGDFMGRVYVFTGEQFAGGTASIVRMATLQDLRDLPRK